MHLPGHQFDPTHLTRDLWRLSRWESARLQASSERASAAQRDQ
jgi:hypothetical protein